MCYKQRMVLLGIFVVIFALLRAGSKKTALSTPQALIAAVVIMELLVLASGAWHEQAMLLRSL